MLSAPCGSVLPSCWCSTACLQRWRTWRWDSPPQSRCRWAGAELGYPGCRGAGAAGHSTGHIVAAGRGWEAAAGAGAAAVPAQGTAVCACGWDGRVRAVTRSLGQGHRRWPAAFWVRWDRALEVAWAYFGSEHRASWLDDMSGRKCRLANWHSHLLAL